MLTIPQHPLLLAKFAQDAFPSATFVAKRRFQSSRTQALFAGLAAHSFLSLHEPLSASFGIVLGAAAHTVGWPIPRGGAQSITNALCAYLESLGGVIHVASRIENLNQLPACDLTFCDISPEQLLAISGKRLTADYRRKLGRFRRAPGVFKVDYALSAPIPWKAKECLRAATVHLGGSMEEIAAGESEVAQGKIPERPFVLLSQPTLFDPMRAPAGKHIAWAYCHVPNGNQTDMLPALESQIERFAPGFRECVLEHRTWSPAALEHADANLLGGDISGGALSGTQFLLRPTWRQYATPAPNIFLCSSSTPPGGGVHGMCGCNAAMIALQKFPRKYLR